MSATSARSTTANEEMKTAMTITSARMGSEVDEMMTTTANEDNDDDAAMTTAMTTAMTSTELKTELMTATMTKTATTTTPLRREGGGSRKHFVLLEYVSTTYTNRRHLVRRKRNRAVKYKFTKRKNDYELAGGTTDEPTPPPDILVLLRRIRSRSERRRRSQRWKTQTITTFQQLLRR